MESAGNTQKRKKCYDEEAEEDEEAKMEKFLCLVKSIRESRERLMNSGSDIGKRKIKENEEKRVGVWKPEFEVEDFVEEQAHNDGNQKQLPVILSTAHSENRFGEDKLLQGEKGMDLTLSL